MSDQNTDDLAQAKEHLETILDHMAIGATVNAKQGDDKLLLEVDCDDEDNTQRVIGRRGQVIDALQHLVNKMLARARDGRDEDDRGKPVIVDAGGYRERHVERLEGLADRMATKAKDSGREVDLNPMSAYDRRIVHLYLAEMDGVSTRSEGEGQGRHIVVVPD